MTSTVWKVPHNTLVGEVLEALADFQHQRVGRQEFQTALETLAKKVCEQQEPAEEQVKETVLYYNRLLRLYPDDTDMMPSQRIRHVAEFFQIGWDEAAHLYSQIRSRGFAAICPNNPSCISVGGMTYTRWTGHACA